MGVRFTLPSHPKPMRTQDRTQHTHCLYLLINATRLSWTTFSYIKPEIISVLFLNICSKTTHPPQNAKSNQLSMWSLELTLKYMQYGAMSTKVNMKSKVTRFALIIHSCSYCASFISTGSFTQQNITCLYKLLLVDVTYVTPHNFTAICNYFTFFKLVPYLYEFVHFFPDCKFAYDLLSTQQRTCFNIIHIHIRIHSFFYSARVKNHSLPCKCML